MLPEKYVKAVQEAYKARTANDLSYNDAYEKAARLVRLIKAVYGFLEPEFYKTEDTNPDTPTALEPPLSTE